MLSETRGKYVCCLCDGNYSSNHAIGVDCDSCPKHIWDCCERYALELTMKNLHRCCGHNSHFEKIKYVGQLKQYGQKSKKLRNKHGNIW